MATKVVDVDLAEPPRDLVGLEAYTHVWILLRWRRIPVGRLWIEVENGRVSAADLWRAASAEVGNAVIPHIVGEMLDRAGVAPEPPAPLPSASVVVVTRDRVEDLRRCLASLVAAVTPGTEVIVVDNAPPDDATARLAAQYPVRYVREPRQGEGWARARGAEVARGEIVAYVDDDAVVDPGWLDALAEPFANPEVAAVTGLVIPLELETEAQEQFERHNGFTFRGFVRREFSAHVLSPLSAGLVGVSACMAVRRRLIVGLRLFSLEMGVGTATRSGVDIYALYRLLSLGHRIVYNPEAFVRHRHRRSRRKLEAWVHGYSVGAFCFFLRALLQHGELTAARVAMSWLRHHHLRQLWRGIRRRSDAQPLRLTFAEIRGVLASPHAHLRSRRHESEGAASQRRRGRLQERRA